jgi:tRNA threonylcarbamoyl adenosine modification protein YeaZ
MERALRDAETERETIDCIAVGLGPGSYAGIRAAVAVAQGWRIAREVRLLGLSSMEVLAEQVRSTGMRGKISLVVDAQRGEVYWARYLIGVEGCQSIEPLRLANRDDLRPTSEKGEPFFGPDPGMVDRGVRLLTPSAATLAMIAARCDDDMLPECLEPIYLRVPSFVKAPPSRLIPVVPTI